MGPAIEMDEQLFVVDLDDLRETPGVDSILGVDVPTLIVQILSIILLKFL